MTNKRKIINDPVYGFLTIDDDIIYDIISHPYFQRQRNIRQLGFTYLVYPGAVHSRFSHMLGALNLMQRAIGVLRSKGVPISHEESLGVQLAILLHDIGHGPFSHTSERVLCNVHHETLTLLFMHRLNQQFDGRLSLAISIFDDSYPRHFLHQLVSSQLDMDRLDYLARDSFFTGVSEGIVGTERIINMLNVKDDMLVVDEKGIYSIEKFIISRRLMYWQVYLHKTVIAADNVFYSILHRARQLSSMGTQMTGNPDLLFFLSSSVTEADFYKDPSLLDRFASIDDNDVLSSIKLWTRLNDQVLSLLATQLIYRQLPAIRVAQQPFNADLVNVLRTKTMSLYDIADHDADFFVGTGQLVNHAYSFDDKEIKVLFKDGRCLGISEASDQLDRPFLEKTVTKYYLHFPKELK
ncbi:MAG: HD domain-containing protein [Bacteroidales bacterium]|nr:HD domain-containing protein [Bacteroidales bacterium]